MNGENRTQVNGFSAGEFYQLTQVGLFCAALGYKCVKFVFDYFEQVGPYVPPKLD